MLNVLLSKKRDEETKNNRNKEIKDNINIATNLMERNFKISNIFAKKWKKIICDFSKNKKEIERMKNGLFCIINKTPMQPHYNDGWIRLSKNKNRHFHLNDTELMVIYNSFDYSLIDIINEHDDISKY